MVIRISERPENFPHKMKECILSQDLFPLNDHYQVIKLESEVQSKNIKRFGR